MREGFTRVPPRTLTIVVFLAAASTLLLEVALTRTASALFFTHITTLLLAACLAALGLGAAFAHRFATGRAQAPTFLQWLLAVGALSGVFALLAIAHAPLLFLAGAFAGPFFCAGALAAESYRLSPTPSRIFAGEALGGALGALVAPAALDHFGDVTTALFALLLLLPAALLLLPSRRGHGSLLLFLPLLAVFASHLFLPNQPLATDPFSAPGFLPHLVEQTRGHTAHVLRSRVDSYARTDLVQTEEPWLRYLYTDRMYPARVLRWDGLSPQFSTAEPNHLARLKRLPFAVLRPSRVLVLGAGGGFDVALALQSGAQHIDAVEVNAAMVALVQDLGDFSGRIFARRDVSVHVEEARRFLRAPHAPWDVVQLSLMQADSSVLRGVAGVQNWVMTVQAAATYFAQLTQHGTLVVVQNTPEIAERTLWTLVAALQARGVPVQDVPQHVILLNLPMAERNPFSQLLLVRLRPFGADERASLTAAATALGASERALPPTPPDFVPPTDARPNFYPAHPLLLVLNAALAAVAVACAWWLFARRRRSRPPLPPRAFAQALFLGAGLMLLQAALLADAQFLLGRAPVAVAWTIGGLLTASALGAVLAQRLNLAPQRQLVLGALGVVVLCLVHLLLGPTAPLALTLPPSWTHVAVALAVLPLGLALGPCFPAFLAAVASPQRPALYAVDGLGAVAGGALAVLLHAEFGVAAVWCLAAACYALLAFLAIKAPSNPTAQPQTASAL